METTKLLKRMFKETTILMGHFNNAKSLKDALSELPGEQYGALVEEDKDLLLEYF